MTPQSGPVGSVITFTGSHLSGWQAYVRMFDRQIPPAPDNKIVANSFDVTVPMDLPQGFHEIRIDISRLYRKTFFFEITP